MSERTYYVLCEDNCRFEAMTKEQIIAAIAEATGATPTSIDDAFITKIKELNENDPITFWVGTQAEYNALSVTATPYKMYVGTDKKIYLTPLSAADVPSHASTHKTGGTDALTAADVGALPASGGTMGGILDMGNHKITNLSTPAASTDAATKNYVDNAQKMIVFSGGKGIGSAATYGSAEVIFDTGNTLSIPLKNLMLEMDITGFGCLNQNASASIAVLGLGYENNGTDVFIQLFIKAYRNTDDATDFNDQSVKLTAVIGDNGKLREIDEYTWLGTDSFISRSASDLSTDYSSFTLKRIIMRPFANNVNIQDLKIRITKA